MLNEAPAPNVQRIETLFVGDTRLNRCYTGKQQKSTNAG